MTPRIDGYLSREIRFERRNGDVEIYKLHIVKPIDPVLADPHWESSPRLRIFMADFEIIPFSEEIPFIAYIDGEIRIKEIATGELVMLI